jgi:hypothetical protein
MWKILARWGCSLSLVYAFGCAALYSLQSRFIFAPTATITETPKRYGLSYQEIWLPMSSAGHPGDRIHGWWIPAASQSTRTLLYFHGNGLNIGANAEQASRFHQLGLSVFLFDYRGYGKSKGVFPSEATVYADAQRAWDYLTQDRKIMPRSIVIYGHSLGGAIAINLAVNHPEAAGLIVQSSFSSALDMARRNWWTVIFPVNILLSQRFASINKVPSLKMPTLYIHGTADELIPFEMSQRLYGATRSSKQLKLFPKAGHNNVAKVGGITYSQTIQAFVRQTNAVTSLNARSNR